MSPPDDISLTSHDDLPPDDAAAVDAGLGASNDAAAPLHEVRPVSCFARRPNGEVVGGAIGRTWGPCAELQQIRVHPDHRRRGIGSSLVRAFERRAQLRGCRTFYLETFSFQAPELYRTLGYEVAYEHAVYPHGIVKSIMIRTDRVAPPD